MSAFEPRRSGVALALAIVTLTRATRASADPALTALPYEPDDASFAEAFGDAKRKAQRWGTGWKDRSEHRRPLQVAMMGLLYGSFTDVVVGADHNVFGPGLSLRAAVPLFHDGLLPEKNDSLELEVGADAYLGIPDQIHRDSFIGLVPDASLRWTLYVGPSRALYAKAGAELDVGVGRSWWPAFVWPTGSLGVLSEISPRMHLRFEIGWPAVRAGFSFDVL